MSDRVGIIGAGPAGLAAAYSLVKLGVPVDVFEATSRVAGMARTFNLWGQKVDLGPHRFFSADARVNRLWLEVVDSQYRMVNRQTRIYYDGNFFDYPLQLSDALPKLGLIEAAHCLLSYSKQQFHRDTPTDSFEDWVQRRFGRRLYDIFFRSYSEKLWGIPCSQLDADFAAQRIKKLSLYEAVRNALVRGRGNQHATLVDRFAYPIGGTGSVYEKMASLVSDHGGKVHLNRPIQRVLPSKKGTVQIEFSAGERQNFRTVISTMPLTHLVGALPGIPAHVLNAAKNLRFRNTIIVYLQVEAQDLFPDQWIYVHSEEVAVGRITNYRNWVPELYEDASSTIISLEFWCDPGDENWIAPDIEHITNAKIELVKTGLIGDSRISAGHVERIPNCYPIYDIGYKQQLEILQTYLNSVSGLEVIGRYGSFKYNNQDHSLLMGLLVAENVAQGSQHDMWSINADDVYQESAIISETGLVPQSQ